MRTAIAIVADLVRSLVLSGLAAAALLLGLVALSAMTGYGLWRLWLRLRR